MSGTLIVWKAPVVGDEDAAKRLLAGYYATGDETAFEPSPDVGAFYDELLDRYPPLEHIEGEAPATWTSTPERSNRVVSIDYSWSASYEVLDDVERLARKHELMFYDPQGPTIRGPHPPVIDPVAPNSREVARVTLIGLAAAAAAVGAWYVSITILSWVVIVVAAFVTIMAVLTLVAYAGDYARAR